MKMRRKIFACLVCVSMLFTLAVMPAGAAFAEETEGEPVVTDQTQEEAAASGEENTEAEGENEQSQPEAPEAVAQDVPAVKAEGDVEINKANFPDDIFRNWVITNIAGGTTTLTQDKINTTTSIDVRNMGIANLKGIEHFTALTDLECGVNQLKSLDVSNNKALTYLYCSNNQLTSLNINNNTKLTRLLCSYNKNLTNLDVSKDTALTYLYCNFNQLTSLDVSKNTKLTYLSCFSNKLTDLNVSNNTELRQLYCSGNQLTSLDLSKNTSLNDCSVSPQTPSLIAAKNAAGNYVVDLKKNDPAIDLSKVSELASVNGTVNSAEGTITYTSLPDAKTADITYEYNTDNSAAGKMSVSATVKEGYGITYNANGADSGSVPKESTLFPANETATVLGNTGNLVKTGYTFAGWNTEANGSGTEYKAGSTFTITNDVTLYAEWTKKSSASDGGSSDTSDPNDLLPWAAAGVLSLLAIAALLRRKTATGK